MEGDLERVIRLLAENRWPWRLHATYNETICGRSTSSAGELATSSPDELVFALTAETIDARMIVSLWWRAAATASGSPRAA